MKYVIVMRATHEDKEYWEVDIPEDTDLKALAIKFSDDPYLVVLDLNGDLIDSDAIQTAGMEFHYMYKPEKGEANAVSLDLEDDVSP